MRRSQMNGFLAVVALALLAAFSAPAFPQESEDAAAETRNSAVESILREQEQALAGARFSYNPGSRRDPFQDIFSKIDDPDRGQEQGAAGMLITEMDLVGIAKDRVNGDIALFVGSDNKGYFLRVGDGFYDGRLIGVDSSSGIVTFRQKVSDPRRIKPYRDIEKRLKPLDNEGSGK